jgi:hypothetical protein
LGDGGTVRKLVVATTAGADDAMPARREKAIFGFSMWTLIVIADSSSSLRLRLRL